MYSYTTPPQSKLADLLGGNVSRLLGDKSYDKRKAAGQEIEGAVRAALEQMTAAQEQLKDLKMRQAQLGEKHPDHQPLEDQILQVWRVVSTQERCIRDIISALHEDFLLHALPNHRKGGLIAFASVAIALERSELERFLPQLIPPLLSAFSDPEPRVRYYACEALYNLLKVSWDLSLKFLNDIFDGVCKLYGDVDHDVRAGILFVDRLLKEIFVSAVNWGGKESFLLLLVKRCRVKNPFIKLLALSWIALLDSVPDIDMLQYLHLFIESLFEMLADSNRDIRHAADACVASLLEEVREGAHDRSDVRDLAAVVQVVLKSLRNPDSFCRLTALVWLQQLLSLALQPVAAPPSPTSSHGGELREEAEKVNTPGDGETKHEHQAELERRVQQQYEKRRQWQMDMQKQLQPLFAHIVDGVLQCAADREEGETRRKEETKRTLFCLLSGTLLLGQGAPY
ncbi:heat repeat-containing protein [Cystoisospora suis]|uniref:Heat repeat-containing protein n=1 Tax=Cystoisospora suis TaxID=483139 RepID=A0A2C6JZX2_9APIC|nr:heat repeat-containing protein [Cystoisospora suis]